MDTLVQELEKLLSFKDTTTEGDIVVLASAEPEMLLYALVTGITPDPQRKKNWWNISMQVLTLPPREVIWTLREPQFNGQEVFTFDGVEHFMKAVRFKTELPPDSSEKPEAKKTGSPQNRLRVIK